MSSPIRIFLLVLALAVTAFPQTGAITEYPMPPGAGLTGIALGSDGAVWFTASPGNFIGRITTAGTLSQFPLPRAFVGAGDITAGPDGSLWFTEQDAIGRITPSGVISESFIPTANSWPVAITSGPDGNLWFIESRANQIGRLTTAGVFTEFAIPTPNCTPLGIAAGPDGALWFTEQTGNKIGRISTAGVFIEYPIPTPISAPSPIALGPDGALWFAEQVGNKIGRVTAAGAFSEYPIPGAQSNPLGITAGPDGALWFTESNTNRLGRITTAGTISEYPVPTAASGPRGIAAGPDGALWFTEFNVSQIGRVAASHAGPAALSIAISHAGDFSQSQLGAIYTVVVSNGVGAGTTSGIVTVTASIPAGLVPVSLAGPGWTCSVSNATCTRGDALVNGAAWPPITITVNVAAAAASPQVTSVFVSGGGSPGANAVDPTAIVNPPPAGSITEYPLPTASSDPHGIVAGPDGALWFAESGGNRIGRITTGGALTEYPAGESPNAIVAGPDGALWFTEPNIDYSQDKVARMTTGGALTEFPSGFYQDLAFGLDGALWLTSGMFGGIARITTSGTLSAVGAVANSATYGITAGPDGELWFGQLPLGASRGNLGRIAGDGTFTAFPLPASNSNALRYPTAVTAGPDGALWFADCNGNAIGRGTTSGSATEFAAVVGCPTSIAAGADGGLWFTEQSGNKIGRMAVDGTVQEYAVPTANAAPQFLAPGPDGALWFTESAGNKIGRIQTGRRAAALQVAVMHAGNFLGQQNALFTVTVSNAGAGMTSGVVTVTDALPAGLTMVSMAGAGWTCPSGTNACVRSDALGGGLSYPPITVTVNVASNAASPLLNTVFAADAVARVGAADSVYIGTPYLMLSGEVDGDVTAGQQGVIAELAVINNSTAPTSGTVTVTATVFAGLTLVSMSGTGWTCPPRWNHLHPQRLSSAGRPLPGYCHHLERSAERTVIGVF